MKNGRWKDVRWKEDEKWKMEDEKWKMEYEI